MILSVSAQTSDAVTVACVGDYGASVLPGVMMQDLIRRYHNNEYELTDYVNESHTVLENGFRTFYKGQTFALALERTSDFVLICFGYCDSAEKLWDAEKFTTAYEAIVLAFLSLPNQPRVVLLYPPYAEEGNKYGARQDVILNEVIPIQEKIASWYGLTVLDLNAYTRALAEQGKSVNAIEYANAVWRTLCNEGVLSVPPERQSAAQEFLNTFNPDEIPVVKPTKTQRPADAPEPDFYLKTETDQSDSVQEIPQTSDSTEESSVLSSVVPVTDFVGLSTVEVGAVTFSAVSVSSEDPVSSGSVSSVSDPPKASFPLLPVTLCSVAVIAAGVTAVFLFRRKK